MNFTKAQAKSNAVKSYKNKELAIDVAKQVKEIGEGAYIAVAACIAAGTDWNIETVSKALSSSMIDANELTFHVIEKELKELGLLARQSNKYSFSTKFWNIAEGIFSHERELMTAKMTPFTQPVGDWTTPHRSDLNLDFISNVEADFLERMIPSVIPAAYEAANKLQQVGYRVNTAIIPHIDKLMLEVSTKADVAKKIASKAYRAFKNDDISRSEMQEAYKEKNALEMEFRMLELQQRMLKDLSEQGTAYFTVTFDYRGRMYYRGGMLTPQGHDFQKAAFQYAEARPLGTHGWQAVAIHFANVYGMDKAPINDRIRWAKTEGKEVAAKVAAGEWPVEADKPYQTMVAALEWNRIITLRSQGVALEDIQSTLVCHQDGTCNGLQHGAAITGSRKTAIAVNCTASSMDDQPSDVYALATKAMIEATDELGLVKLTEALIKVGRAAMKNPVMVTGYGAGTATAVRDMSKALLKAEQHEAIREIENSEEEVKEAMKSALEQTAGAMVALNDLLQNGIQEVAHKALYWTTADGFYVQQAARAKKQANDDYEDERKFYAKGTSFETRIDGISESAQICAISPNFVHSIDAAHLRMVVANTDAQIAAVHDSIGSHAGDFFEVAKVIREQFVAVHRYDQLADFATENGIKLDSIRLGNYDPSEALESSYIFS